MKRSFWHAYAIAPSAGPLVYGIAILFSAETIQNKEFSAVTWTVSLAFFTLVSYLACLIFGGPLIAALKKTERLKFWWIVLPGSALYAFSLYLTLFVLMGAEIVGSRPRAIGGTLLMGFGLGIIVTALFSILAGIPVRPGGQHNKA